VIPLLFGTSAPVEPLSAEETGPSLLCPERKVRTVSSPAGGFPRLETFSTSPFSADWSGAFSLLSGGDLVAVLLFVCFFSVKVVGTFVPFPFPFFLLFLLFFC